MCVKAHWWAVLVSCVVKHALLFSLLVLYQWSPLWTWRLWSTLSKAGRRTPSSLPAHTAWACHLKPRKPALGRRGSTFSSWRGSSSTTTSGLPSTLLIFSKLWNLQTSWPLKLLSNLTSAFSAGLLLMSMTNVSTFPFLMRSANGGEGNKFLQRLYQNPLKSWTPKYSNTTTPHWSLFLCSTRTYTVPDPAGLFDGHVWPMYLKHRKEMEDNCNSIGL